MHGIATLRGYFPEGTSKTEQVFLVLTSAIFVAMTVLAIVLGNLVILFIPFGLFLLFFLFYDHRVVFIFFAITTPFSIELLIPGTSSAIWFPTEALILVLLGFWVIVALFSRKNSAQGLPSARLIDRAVLVFLAALGLSVVTSTYPTVSIKEFLVMAWYIGACYFYPRKYFPSSHQMSRILFIMLCVSSAFVAMVTLRQVQMGFSMGSAAQGIAPFFLEHGSYAAHLSLVAGLGAGVAFGVKENIRHKVVAAVGVFIMFMGVIFSYTRGAWLGMGALVVFFFIMKAREFLRPKAFLFVAVATGVLAIAVTRVGVQSNLETHVKSMGDVERDLSNLERVNRWVAAVNIIHAHPYLGVGFGTYAIHYYTYHDRRLETLVSDFYGFPHNDYLQFWAEAGLPGILSYLALIVFVFFTGIRKYFRIKDQLTRNLLLGCLGAVLTYLVHSLVNGFLYVDKVAVPFWIALAFAVNIIATSEERSS